MGFIKEIFFSIDSAIYSFAKQIYSSFCILAGVNIMDSNPDFFQTFTTKLFAIIGIVMLFVLAFNFLTYIVNPDKVKDAKVGGSKTIIDILIALIAIVALPTVFNKLYSLQSQILTSNVISQLIFQGVPEELVPNNSAGSNTSSIGKYYIENGANMMIANVFSTFLTPKDEKFKYSGCNDPNNSYYGSSYCDAYNNVAVTGDIGFFRDMIKDNDVSYQFIISICSGIVLVFFMLSFCIDVGKRVGKLFLLQFIAPISFLLEILPNKKGTREKWIETTIKTYLDVFLYLAVIFITILLITFVPSITVLTLDEFGGGFHPILTVLLIFGLLQFGKEAPKMLSDLLGLKDTGTISAAIKRGTAMAGVALNTTESTLGNAFRGITENKGLGRLTGFAGGATSALARNLWAGRNVHSFGDAKKNRMSINEGISTRRINRQAYNYTHGGLKGAAIGHVKDFLRDKNKALSEATSLSLGYRKKREMERAFAELGKKKRNIMDIVTNDAEYQQLRSAWINHGSNVSVNDKFYNAMVNRASKVFDDHQDEFRVALGEYKGFIGANQNVEGMWSLDKVNKYLDYKNLNKWDDVFEFDGKGNLVFADNAIKDSAAGDDVSLDITDASGKTVNVKGKAKDILEQDYGYREKKANETIDEHVRQAAQETLNKRKEENTKK